jgi:hypothetical protein
MDHNSILTIDQVMKEMEKNTKEKTIEEFRIQLIKAVEQLLQNDFPRLIQVLYRLDVDEEKLKNELRKHQAGHTAELIADMIIKRQLEKQEMRKRFGGSEHNSEEDKW